MGSRVSSLLWVMQDFLSLTLGLAWASEGGFRGSRRVLEGSFKHHIRFCRGVWRESFQGL